MTTVEKISYGGWDNCYRLSNELVDLIITTDVGPRIIRFGFVDGVNEFAEFSELLGRTGDNEWRIYGGHRFWHAPEHRTRTYYPDNSPITLEQHDGFVRTIQAIEPPTGIQKTLDISMSSDSAHVRVVHRLQNHNAWAIETAPWGLSVMTTGGRSILPLPPRGLHTEELLPTNTLTLWAYTDMSDPRWIWGEKYIMLKQDASATTPQKIGLMTKEGWAGYANHNNLFIKTFAVDPNVPYPDMGCCIETFTNSRMLEVESFGALVTLEPGATVEHVENWYLFGNVPQPTNDADIERDVLPKVQSVK